MNKLFTRAGYKARNPASRNDQPGFTMNWKAAERSMHEIRRHLFLQEIAADEQVVIKSRIQHAKPGQP